MLDYRQKLTEFLPAVAAKRHNKSDRKTLNSIEKELRENEDGRVRRDDDELSIGLCALYLSAAVTIAARYERRMDWEWQAQNGRYWRATPALNGSWILLCNGVQTGGAPFDYALGCSMREFDTLASALRYALIAAL